MPVYCEGEDRVEVELALIKDYVKPREERESPFYVSKYHITEKQFHYLTGDFNRRIVVADDHPKVGINWFNAMYCCNRLSRNQGLEPYYKFDIPIGKRPDAWVEHTTTGSNGYRLPTVDEWMFLQNDNTIYAGGSNDLEATAWYQENSGNETHPVGLKQPNKFGLYDMAGNVWEFTDTVLYNENYIRVMGGAYDSKEAQLSAYADPKQILKTAHQLNVGIRVVRNFY